MHTERCFVILTKYIFVIIVFFSANLEVFSPLTFNKQNSNYPIGMGISSVGMFANALPFSCECNYGVIINETNCSCQCFDGYLLPNCLFTAEKPNVGMSLWIRTNKTDNINSIIKTNTFSSSNNSSVLCWFDYHDVIDTLASAFAISNRLFHFVYAKEWFSFNNGTLVDGIQWPSVYTSSNEKFSYNNNNMIMCSNCANHANEAMDYEINNNVMEQIIMLVIEMPGWVAQHLYNDALHDKLSEYVIHNSNNNNSNNKSYRCEFILFAVDMHKSKPLPSLHYNSQWIRLTSFGDRGWYLTLPQFGWFIGFVLIVVFIFIIELKWAFNVDYNVGGGVIWQASLHKRQDVKRQKKPTHELTNEQSKQIQTTQNNNNNTYHHQHRLSNLFHRALHRKGNNTNKQENHIHELTGTELIELRNGNTITKSNIRARHNDHNNITSINKMKNRNNGDDHSVAYHGNK